MFSPAEIEQKTLELLVEGHLAPNKGKKPEELPPEWHRLRELFRDENIEAWLSGKFLDSEDPVEAKTASTIAANAPIALKLANQIIDGGLDRPLREATKLELDHLNEIFSTADAWTGLSNVGRKGIRFEGR